MPQHIPIPATVRVSIFDHEYGKFPIYPEVVHTASGLEIVSWTAKDKDGNDRKLYDLLAQSVLPRKLMCEVCRLTFESDTCPSVPVTFQIGDEAWEMHMRAVEKEFETVHYEIETDGEWMEMLETYVGDIVPEDNFIFAENEVRPNIDFGNTEAIYEKMA